MVQCDVRYTKVATEIHNETETERANDESDEEQVTVYFKMSADRLQEKAEKRLTCFRVSTDLVLLAVVLGFGLLQLYGWWPDSEGIQNSESTSLNILKEHDDHHNHSSMDDDEHHDGEESHHHEHAALYHHAVVLTSSANCSSIGKALLQEGGNIVDAAIASLLCLGVVHPHTAGVGGIFSAVLYNSSSNSLKTICSATPQNSSTPFLVPSILQGIQELHSRWGRSKWRRLFKEAITLAQEGFQIDNILARALESHKEQILASKLCNLFCDANGHVKSVGEIVQNQNLAKLLQSASLNENNFLKTLAVKLSKDLSSSEKLGFLAAIQHSHGEINDSVIVEGEKYSVLSASFPFAGQMLSDILEQVRQQRVSFKDGADFNQTSTTYSELLNLIQVRNNSALAEKYPGVEDTFFLNTQNSHVTVLDQSGNFLIISASLNSTWGSGRFLPSSGVLLNSFNANLSNSPHFNIPLVLRITEDDGSHNDDTEDNEEGNEMEVVAVIGGLSAVFNAVTLLHNRIDFGMSSKETLSFPLLHLEPGMYSAFCLSAVINDSDICMRFSEVGHELQQVDECSDYALAMILRLHAKHISAYGAPAVYSQMSGY